MGAFDGATMKYSGLIAGSGLDSPDAQYRFVQFDSNNLVQLCTNDNGRACGVLQAPVPEGQAAEVVYLGETFVQVPDGNEASAGQPIACDGNARAKTATGDNAYQMGTMVLAPAGGNDGRLATAVVNCINPPLVDNS